jgi:hypothetical protein
MLLVKRSKEICEAWFERTVSGTTRSSANLWPSSGFCCCSDAARNGSDAVMVFSILSKYCKVTSCISACAFYISFRGSLSLAPHPHSHSEGALCKGVFEVATHCWLLCFILVIDFVSYAFDIIGISSCARTRLSSGLSYSTVNNLGKAPKQLQLPLTDEL